MECNFRLQIYRQSQTDNMHICPVSAEIPVIVEMTSKIIFEIKSMLRERRILFAKKFVMAFNICREFTEKVQAWKLFSEKALFSR
jgi:hypothetical protein